MRSHHVLGTHVYARRVPPTTVRWAVVIGNFLAACAGDTHQSTDSEGASACSDGGSCEPRSKPPDDDPLTCQPGTRACSCSSRQTCLDPTDTCQNGSCRPAGCAAGSEWCACDQGVCDTGLFCELRKPSPTCVDDRGHPGGACIDGVCRGASRCDPQTDTCVFCNLGSLGCLGTEGTCDSGLVAEAGRCVVPRGRPPQNPQCPLCQCT